ncbi:MAG: DUF192 domain-containing protein [bacterium]|nr:MAG: DUF192 domain-containing protein [bacterium]
MISLVEPQTGRILLHYLKVRSTFFGRLRGFAFMVKPGSYSGMLFLDAGRVHTFGTLFCLDLYFFDQSLRLQDLRLCVPPNRCPSSPRGTRHILEVPHTGRSGLLPLSPGDQVSLLYHVQR